MAENSEKSKKPIYKKWWFWIIIIIAVVAIGGSQSGKLKTTNSNTSSITSSDSNQEKQTKEKFSLVDSEGSYDGFAYYINGSIVNNTDKQYSYVQVTFNLYDASGAQIGTALANINNLDPNGTWKFKAMGGTQNAASYKLAEITGW